MRSAATTTRHTRAVESFRNAAETIGELTPGMSLFAVTRGQWSMIDAILHCLDQTGPAAISLWTWTVAEYEVQSLTRLQIDQRLTAATLIIDKGAQKKNAAIIESWQASFGPDSVRWVANHAKLATIQNAQWRLLLRGSMNLNFNPRFEQFDLTEGGPDFDLVHRIESELPILHNPTYREIQKASKLDLAYSADQLQIFTPRKVWAK